MGELFDKKIDERTKNYLADCRNNVGWLGCNNGWYGIKEILEKKNILQTASLQKLETYDGYMNSSDIDVYSYEIDGRKRYCAELSYQTDIDDYCTETHIFNQCPTRESVLTARLINDIEFAIKFKGFKTEFNCWECGKHVHWLDNEKGTLEQKFDRMKERFCGFCDNI